MQPITAKVLFKGLWPGAPAGTQITSVVTDSRNVTPGCVFVAICGERVDGHTFAASAYDKGALFVVANHPVDGVPPDRTVIVDDVLDAMIAMGANYRAQFSPLVLGVTGSVGKTTTKEFSASLFAQFGETLKTEGNQNNEIGLPNTLFRLTEDTRYAVLEMGMQKEGEIRKLTLAARPDAAIITKIGEAHIEHLGSIEAVLRAKMEICDGLSPGSPLILNGDDSMLRGAVMPEDISAVYAGVFNTENDVLAANICNDGKGQGFEICDKQFGKFDAYIPALGLHNVHNALLAYTAATRLGLNAEGCAAALGSYEPTGMRQRISQHKGIVVIKDYYNANPDSMKAALDVLAGIENTGNKVAVLGDMLELGSVAERAHRELGKNVFDAGVNMLITVGPMTAYTSQEAQNKGVRAVHVADNREAADLLNREIEPGDAVLLKASRGMKFEEIAEQAEFLH